jgi:NAD(P)-dependent dehydrogenase (short-subunit alcohol dehydrogenase family)
LQGTLREVAVAEAGSVLISGASGSIGSATVAALDQAGWRVFAGVRRPEAGRVLVRRFRRVVPVELDLCDERSVAAARAQIEAELGDAGLVGLVNLAGISVDGPVELIPLEAWRRAFEVNVIGHVAVTQQFLPLLRRASGRIINIGGAAGKLALPMYGALSASKAGLDRVTDALRMELKHQGIFVSYIEPGAVKDDFFRKSADAAKHQGYAGDPATQAIYSRAMGDAAKALSEGYASPVENVARVVVKALTARRPAARYIVGREARMGLRLLLHMPAAIRDRTMMSSLGLKRGSLQVDAAPPPPASPGRRLA